MAIALDTDAVPGGVLINPSQDCDLYLYSFASGADNDTYDPGIRSSGRNVVRYAFRLSANGTTRTASVSYSATTGLFSFDFSTGTNNQVELYVWVK